MVREAGEDAPAALERLCRTYWNPVHSYICNRGHDAESARDLTQSFFSNALENGWFSQARRDRGSFRSFLLASIRHFLANEWDKTMSQKRGGGQKALPLDSHAGEPGDQVGAAERLTPEIIFDRQCAIALLEAALSRLRLEYEARGQSALFDRLKPFLAGEQDRGAYGELEEALHLSGGSLRVAVHRLRRRYAELLRAEIAETVSNPAEIDAEIQHLFVSLGNP